MNSSPSLIFGLSSFVILATPKTTAICRYCLTPGLNLEALHPTYKGEPEPVNTIRAEYCDPSMMQRADMWHDMSMSSFQGTLDHAA